MVTWMSPYFKKVRQKWGRCEERHKVPGPVKRDETETTPSKHGLVTATHRPTKGQAANGRETGQKKKTERSTTSDETRRSRINTETNRTKVAWNGRAEPSHWLNQANKPHKGCLKQSHPSSRTNSKAYKLKLLEMNRTTRQINKSVQRLHEIESDKQWKNKAAYKGCLEQSGTQPQTNVSLPSVGLSVCFVTAVQWASALGLQVKGPAVNDTRTALNNSKPRTASHNVDCEVFTACDRW